MFTLALLLALSAHQPPHVCIMGHVGPDCDYTYNSLEQAAAEAPRDAVMFTAGAWIPLRSILEDSHRQEQAMRRWLERYSVQPYIPNGCVRVLSPDVCGRPPTLVQL